MNIYVGNLSREVTEDDLREAFGAFGQVESVAIVKDKYSGQSRGFGFIEIASKAEARAAIGALDLQQLKGRAMTVNEARPQPEARRSKSRGSRKRSGGRRGR